MRFDLADQSNRLTVIEKVRVCLLEGGEAASGEKLRGSFLHANPDAGRMHRDHRFRKDLARRPVVAFHHVDRDNLDIELLRSSSGLPFRSPFACIQLGQSRNRGIELA
ncbi:hypothetical protein [Rhizobium yanglingense]